MARSEYKAVYVGSDDYWGFDSDTFNDATNFYGRAWIVPAAEITEDRISDENLARCQMYFEVGRTDSQLFTPTSIMFDDGANFLLVKGKQGRIGQPEITADKTKAFAVGQLAQRYKNLTDGPSSKNPARFMVNYIVVDNSEEHDEIKAFMDELEGVESEDYGSWEEDVEDVVAEAESEGVSMDAEEMNAENLNRVNPTVVEGAEDIHGAEDMMGLPAADSGLVIGQDYDGLVIGQAAEEISEGYHRMPDGTIMADSAHMAEEEDFGMVGEGNDFGQMRAEAYDYSPDDYDAYEDPTAYDPMAMEADDIVEWVQDYTPFNISGWTASAIVVGIAALSGSWFAKRR
jgi:hypothetical protein